MTDDHPRPCRWCRHHAPGWCHRHDVPVSPVATCADWEREPGADDDRDEEAEWGAS